MTTFLVTTQARTLRIAAGPSYKDEQSGSPAPQRQSASHDAPLSEQRDAVIKDLREVVTQVSRQYFLDHLLPDLHPDIDLDATVAKLREDSVKNRRWCIWPRDPSNTKGRNRKPLHEDVVFKRLETLTSQILDACVSESKVARDDVKCFLKCNPSRAPQSFSRNNDSRPDAYAVLQSTDTATSDDPVKKVQWRQIAVTGEFKKRRTPRSTSDNNTKVIWSLYHTMREDVRRRFAFGFTIEDRWMRLWFCSRSEVLASAEIDFMTEHEYVANFFLRIMFAREEELGWDPTITTLPQSKTGRPSMQYDITVRDVTTREPEEKTYRTKNIIWDYGAEALRGRTTRVWAVVEVTNGVEGADEVVLKESWPDAQHDPEGENLMKIRQAIRDRGSESDLKVFDEIFMRVLAYGEVWIDKRADETHSFKQSRSALEPLGDDLDVIEVKVTAADNLRVVGPPPAGPQVLNPKARKQAPPLRYANKVHRRTVYSQVGRAILDVESLRDTFQSIGRVLAGLGALHKHGWVHHDISYGNVLRVRQSTKIIDLEFAKEVSENKKHGGVRTQGTPYFMSLEVAEDRYLFQPSEQNALPRPQSPGGMLRTVEALDEAGVIEDEDGPSSVSRAASPSSAHVAALEDDDIADPSSGSMSPAPSDLRPDTPTIIFKYNPLHDLESVAWLSLFALLVPEFENNPREDGQKYTEEQFAEFMQAQHDLAWNAFCDPKFRMNILTVPGNLAAHAYGLHPTVVAVLKELNSTFSDLTDAFRAAELDVASGDDNILPTSFAEVCTQMVMRTTNIVKILRKPGQDLTLVEDVTKRRRKHARPVKQEPKAAGPQKRKADDDQDEEDEDATYEEDPEHEGDADDDAEDESDEEERTWGGRRAKARRRMVAMGEDDD